MSPNERSVPRVLIVEDEAHLAEGLLFNLQAEGYEAELARDGEGALARLLPAVSDHPKSLVRGSAGELDSNHGPAQFSGRFPQLDQSSFAATCSDPDWLEADLPDRASAGPDQQLEANPAPASVAGPPFDAVLLDVMLPGKNGFDVVRELRAASIYTPVLMLTARGRPEDVLQGLDAGADDYLSKPFDLSILLARLHVLLRRMRWYSRDSDPAPAGTVEEELPPTFSFAGRTIDFSVLEVRAKGTATRLTLMEADFLRYLSLHPFRIIPRKELLEQVWRVREDTDTRAIDNFVVRLRRYLEDEPTNPVYLKTVRGVGYRFLPHGE